MTLRTLIGRNLRYHWRAHLGVVLGAAVGSAALIGALVVGDSVRGSLREHVTLRLGQVAFALTSGEHFFHQDWEKRFLGVVEKVDEKGRRVLLPTRANSVLVLSGTTIREDGAARANHVQLIGVSVRHGEDVASGRDNGLFGLATQPSPSVILPGEAHLNRALANQLRVKVGDGLVLRVDKAAALPRDAAVSSRGSAVGLRVRVTAIRSVEQFGDFNLRSSATPPLNVFINLSELQSATDLTGRVNAVLVPSQYGYANRLEKVLRRLFPDSTIRDLQIVTGVNSPLWNETIQRLPDAEGFHLARFGIAFQVTRLSDVDLALSPTSKGDALELRSRRVFLDPPVVRAGLVAGTNAQPILTYLANLLTAGTNITPYSMVTAAGLPYAPADMRDGEILVNQWLADDLQLKTGDEIALSYFDPESGARLIERTNRFRVRGIVPMELPWADRTLMPDFPGIEKAESTRDWDAGFPLAHKIRQKDEDYWKQFRGTPKAFVTLAAGQKMWANRFGDLTAIRYPIPTNFTSVDETLRRLRTPLLTPAGTTNSTPVPWEGRYGVPALGPLRGSETYVAEYTGPAYTELHCWHLEQNILALLKPEELGLRFEPVREQALKAAEQSQDFGGLFLGFSFFLIAAALLLMAMLFQLGLEQRAPEIGTLLALGFTPKQVRKLLLGEGGALSLLGGVLGALGGLGYARAMLHGLATIWHDAVGATTLNFHVTGLTLVIGLFASVVVSGVTIWLTLRKFVRRAPRELLAGDLECGDSSPLCHVAQTSRSAVSRVSKPASCATPSALPTWKSATQQVWKPALRWGGTRTSDRCKSAHSKAGWVALLVGGALVGWTLMKDDTANAAAFFGAGALVLLAGLGFVSAWLSGVERRSPTRRVSGETGSLRAGSETGAPISLRSLAVRGCARRRTRSLATVAMLACGSFLIVSIGVFRLDANRDATKRSSGTGGYALIGETTMPVVQDLNSQAGREFFALKETDLKGVIFVPFRVREGDEASCLNLNRAQKPRLLGVRPEMLKDRFAFAKGSRWHSLGSRACESADPGGHATGQLRSHERSYDMSGEIPAIGDANSIQWAMGKKIGDTLDYVDERGQPFKVRIVGAVANSILQGQLIIDEAEFVKRFPGESGYRMFLIDAPSNRVAEVSATLSRAMQDVGLELTPAAKRLAQFNAVRNTYLGTFQVLGGLGLLLGSVGLGIVVLRNVLERRGELAVLLAVGFRTPALQRLLLVENGALLALGLAIGIVAAVVAVLPALLSPGAQLPWLTLTLTLVAVLLNGALWTWAATRVALRGDLLAALRNE